MTLLDRLRTLLSEGNILPADPAKAISGSDLLKVVKPQLKDYAEASIRQTFSNLAADATSPIARVAQGYGYFRRPEPAETAEDEPGQPETRATSEVPPSKQAAHASRETQPEERFRAFFVRHSKLRMGFPMKVEHTAGAHQPAGVNKWKFPDVVVLQWEVGDQVEGGFALDRALLEVKRSLGEQPFRIASIELKVELTLSNFREYFFQCVSNSKWAHLAHLVVATPVLDALLVQELRRLGSSYGVSVSAFSFTRDELAALPNASELLSMSDEEFEKLAARTSPISIATGVQRPELDWDHIRDMRTQSPDFRNLFDWIARCLRDSKAYTIDNFLSLQQIEAEAG